MALILVGEDNPLCSGAGSGRGPSAQSGDIFGQYSEGLVAGLAQDSAYFTGSMIVVDGKRLL